MPRGVLLCARPSPHLEQKRGSSRTCKSAVGAESQEPVSRAKMDYGETVWSWIRSTLTTKRDPEAFTLAEHFERDLATLLHGETDPPEFLLAEALRQASRLTNVKFVSELLQSIRRLECDMAYWSNVDATNTAGIWLHGHQIDKEWTLVGPDAESLKQVAVFTDTLLAHIGVLTGISKESVLYKQPSHSDETSEWAVERAIECCRVNASFMRVLAKAAANGDMSLAVVSQQLKSVVESGLSACGNRMHGITAPASRQSTSQKIAHARKALAEHIKCAEDLGSVTRVTVEVASRAGCTRPSRFVRHRLRYTGLGLASIAATKTLTVTSSTLGGNGSFEKFLENKVTSLRHFANEHAIEPVRGIYEEMLSNVSNSDIAVEFDTESLAESRNSFQRLLEDFEKDHPNMDLKGMKAVLQEFERQVRQPIRSLLSGELARTGIMLAAKLRGDVEELLVSTQRQLSAQRLNLHLLAAVPAVLAAIGLLMSFSILLDTSRRRDDDGMERRSDVIRFLLGDARDILVRLERAQQDATACFSTVKDTGRLAYTLIKAEELAELVRMPSKQETLRRLEQDLRVLESPSTDPSVRVAVVDRMLAVYPFLNHGRQ